MPKLLIANRGEIAIRIARAADELGLATVAVYSEDDALALHARKTDERHALRGAGAAAYLDVDQLVALARERGCDAVHPGYGFLAENAAFARRCAEAGLGFVGPRPEQIELLGDKLRARALAERLGVPVARATERASTLEEAGAFFASLGGAPAVLKAVAGGGGRGIRVIREAAGLPEAFARARSEALAAFGDGSLYMEELVEQARHVEVQVVGDRTGAIIHLGDRECSLQRRHQKLVEVAPSPSIAPGLRERLQRSALRIAEEVSYESLGTFEFLVAPDGRFVFLEANPRLQVEHTVTEEVLGVDLVQTQLRIAMGATLDSLGLDPSRMPTPRGYAIELRVNVERIESNGSVAPSSGSITAYEMPSGPGVRVDGAGYVGYAPSSSFDSLLAKVVVCSRLGSFADAAAKARRALAELRVEGVETNVAFLQALVDDPSFVANEVHTTYLEENAARLASAAAERRPPSAEPRVPAEVAGDEREGVVVVRAPLEGRVASIDVREGQSVELGSQLVVIEAMKMESAVVASTAGTVLAIVARSGESVREGQPLVRIAPSRETSASLGATIDVPEEAREALEEVRRRRRGLLDEARPSAVARRRKTGQRTARENVDDLCDAGTFVEYGAFALAAQRATRSLDELIALSPADGLVGGVATVNAATFGPEASRCMVVAYDYTVFAGTQGAANHKKQDRLFELAGRWRIPLVLFAEGGGGRPGDTDMQVRSMLDVPTFARFAELSGSVPLVGVVSGRCFAGNAALLGCCDVIIATENANIGMGGPVMIEGAGLGRFPPEAIGPIDVQAKNGVVDLRAPDEAAATEAAKRYLSYFQGRAPEWTPPDVEALRAIVPESRKRVYDMRAVLASIVDEGSVLELRREFGRGMITALARIEGRPVGVFANDPTRLAGAIDADAADKASRFMRLCDAFGLPLVSLCDTPGFMVGPAAEETALVRHVCRMLVAGAHLDVPVFTVITRKAYGLGAMAMCGGGTQAPFATIAWPTGELGAMGLEGAVHLAFRKQLAAIEDEAERERSLRTLVAALREQGKALHSASHVEIDDVIDPVDTRRWLARGLSSAPSAPHDAPKKRAFVDPW